jgi:hypothetical protein
MKALFKWMHYFWYRCACPLPDGKFNCWLGGRPYSWTGIAAIPWYLLAYPGWRRYFGSRLRMMWWLVASIIFMPVGFAIWLFNRRWPLKLTSASPDVS